MRFIMQQEAGADAEEEAQKYISEEKEVASVADAIQGAKDIIIAEEISDNAEYRSYIRNITFEEGRIISTAKESVLMTIGSWAFLSKISPLSGDIVVIVLEILTDCLR